MVACEVTVDDGGCEGKLVGFAATYAAKDAKDVFCGLQASRAPRSSYKCTSTSGNKVATGGRAKVVGDDGDDAEEDMESAWR